MTLNELVTLHGDVPFNVLAKTHECYYVVLAEKKYQSVEEQSYEFDLETYPNEWFHKDYLLSGAEEIAERYILSCLENECGVPAKLYVHLIGNETESFVEGDFWYHDEKDVLSHVFEVVVDIGTDFQPDEETPYYWNYGAILSCKNVTNV